MIRTRSLSGRLAYPLASLAQGAHTFKIKAWDNANNSSSVQFSATVANPGRLAIHDLLNYPNPMQAQTTFYFELTEDVQRMTVDIFTVAGRKIKSFIRTEPDSVNLPQREFSGSVGRTRHRGGSRGDRCLYIQGVGDPDSGRRRG